jgi:hypothetical protein
VTKPVGELSGYVEFIERKTGGSESLWNEYRRESILNTKREIRRIYQREEESIIRVFFAQSSGSEMLNIFNQAVMQA